MTLDLIEDLLHGVPVLRLTTTQCTAAFSLHGGQLLSWAPAGAADVLWVSPTTTRPPGAIRGGVPICWPYFAKQGQPDDAIQHGFARNTVWTLASAELDAEGVAELQLSLPASDAVPMRLTQRWRLGTVLQQELTSTQTGDTALTFTDALHTYFHVGDATRVHLEGLEGLDYANKYDGQIYRQQGPWSLDDPRDPGRSDRIYHAAGGHYVLHDPALSRRLEIMTGGSASVVVWNPGAEGARGMKDVPDADWTGFVCIEAANALPDEVTLQPGQSHTLSHQVRVLPG
ncbi:MAG: D-hexose-6-phosphate mutarotase [Pseudoxanthomonas sp.]